MLIRFFCEGRGGEDVVDATEVRPETRLVIGLCGVECVVDTLE